MTPDERAKIAAMMGVATPRFVDGDPRSATAPSLVPKGWKPDTSRRVSTIDQMFNGTGIPERLGLLNSMFNPVTAMQEAGQHSEDMFAPGKTGWERVGSLGGMLSGMAGTVAPMLAASKGAMPAADALMDGLAGYSAMPRAVAGEFMADEFGGLRLYHGSPHDFDKFSMDKIGTGEGAQAYGHGLYFTESDTIARHYRDKVGAMTGKGDLTVDGRKIDWDNPRETAAFEIMRHGGDREAAAAFYEKNFRNSEVPGIIRSGEALPEVNSSGRMYEVDVNANPDDFLDWDAPLSAQPQDVQWLAKDNKANLAARGVFLDDTTPGGHVVQALKPEEYQGYNIPGIKYLDAGSRGAGDGSRNYVVFDENLISIVRKYGVAGAAAMLGMSQADVAQASGIKDDKQAATNAKIAKMMRPQ